MNLKYRPEIDGLRAVAVLSVIIYHADIILFGKVLLKGGFVGVDVFFVISGYLITSIILSDINNGNFTFSGFYERRARRILPALFTVILTTVPFAWWYLLPSELTEYSNSIISALLFGSNIFFHLTGQEYAAESGLLKPFLHTWSLSVEEQFYVIFPAFLLFSQRFGWNKLLYILLICFGVSLVLADWQSHNNPSSAFYLLQYRLWELLAGAILATLVLKFKREANPFLNQVMPALGLALILYSVLKFYDEMFHPSFMTLIPVIGSMLIIWFCTEKSIVSSILASPILRGVGLVSYSFYLWHFPVFAFFRITSEDPTNLDKIGWILLSLVLATVTFFVIEQPFRKRKVIPISFALSTCIAVASTLFIVNSYIILGSGHPERFPDIIKNHLTRHKVWLTLKKNDGSSCYNKTKQDEFCVFNERANKQAFIVGDSHMASIMADLKNKMVRSDYKYTTMTNSGCQYITALNRVTKKTGKVRKGCDVNLQNIRRDTILKEKRGVAIIGGRLPLILHEKKIFPNRNEQAFKDYLQYPNNHLETLDDRQKAISKEYRKSIIDLASQNIKVILIYPIPEIGWNVPKKLLNRFLFDERDFFKKSLSDNPISISYEMYKTRTTASFSLLDSIQHKNVFRVYPHKILCNERIGQCYGHNENALYYVDTNHPTAYISNLINEEIMKIINTIDDDLRPKNTSKIK